MSRQFWFETGTPGANPWLDVVREVNHAHGRHEGACQFDRCLSVSTVNGMTTERYPGALVIHMWGGVTVIQSLSDEAEAEIEAAMATLGEEVVR